MVSEIPLWYAIRVRSRCEKAAAAELSRRGYEVFAAIAAQRRVWVDRVRTVELPLFPGYIFGRFPALRRAAVESVGGVASVVRFGNQFSPVDDWEIESVRLIVGSGIEVIRSPQLRVGVHVRVLAGPLKGAEGILAELKSGHQLIVSVGLLQRTISVEIDEALVEATQRPAAKQLARAGAA